MMPCGFKNPQILQHRPIFTSSALQQTLHHHSVLPSSPTFCHNNLCVSREADSYIGSREQTPGPGQAKQAFSVSSTPCMVQSRVCGFYCSSWRTSQASYQDFCNNFFSLLGGIEGRCEGWSCCSHFTTLGYSSQHTGEVRAKETQEE